MDNPGFKCSAGGLGEIDVDFAPSIFEDSKVKRPSEVSADVNGSAEGVKLERTISLLNGVTIIVGSIIGSGIFISPVTVLSNSGSVGVSVIVWAACGMLSLAGALCYAELGTSITKSGGDFTYIKTAFGAVPGFMYLWVTIMVSLPCQQAIVSLTFADYVSLPFFPEKECPPPSELRGILAAFCMGKYFVFSSTFNRFCQLLLWGWTIWTPLEHQMLAISSNNIICLTFFQKLKPIYYYTIVNVTNITIFNLHKTYLLVKKKKLKYCRMNIKNNCPILLKSPRLNDYDQSECILCTFSFIPTME